MPRTCHPTILGIYRSRRIDIPRAEFYVLYNGKAPFPPKETMRLSEMYRTENKSFRELYT